ncbi:hypothetical protein QQ045_016255 [Rhodiola kirilowii]
MNSPCIMEAVETTPCRGCFPASFLALAETSTPGREGGVVSSYWYDAIASTLHPNTNFTNHESIPSMEMSFSSFLKAFPQYTETCHADEIRAREYYHLSDRQHVCLDYIGHGLFSFHQMNQADPTPSNFPFFEVSYKSVNLSWLILYGGQESETESRIRNRIMSFLNASQTDYSMVFTANHSSAFKMLAECYPFHTYQTLLTAYDCKYDAVEMMMQSSVTKGAEIKSAEFSWPSLRLMSAKFRKVLLRKKHKKRGLLVFPLQSRMTGTRYSYQWMSLAQENGWHVLLDASALGAKDMDTLGLSIISPDFIVCSAYKVFGDNPSGFGCLFVKKTIAPILNNSSAAPSAGIISLESPISISRTQVHEDSSIIDESESEKVVSVNSELFSNDSVKQIDFKGLDHADTLGLIKISNRARYLVNWLVNALLSLLHPNSENRLPLVKIYGPKTAYDRGSSVAFNLFDWKREKIDPVLVQKLADRNSISLSCGVLRHICFTDKSEEMRERVLEKMCQAESGISVVSASIGFLTDFSDVYRVWVYVSKFLDADFVEKERWRYIALNQKTVEI